MRRELRQFVKDVRTARRNAEKAAGTLGRPLRPTTIPSGKVYKRSDKSWRREG